MACTPDQWLSVEEYLEMMKGKMGRNRLYDLIRSGQLPSVKAGGKWVIPIDALDQMLEKRGAAVPAGK